MDKLRCPKCQSADYRTRSTTQEKVCRKCGNVWKKPVNGVHAGA